MNIQSFNEQSYQLTFGNHEQAFGPGQCYFWRESHMKGQFSQFIQAYFKSCISIFYVPRLSRPILRQGGTVLT
jgi:hypothetical protein